MIPNDDELYSKYISFKNPATHVKWLQSLQPGDPVLRLLSGTIRMQAIVVKVDDFIHINATDRPLGPGDELWKFSRRNGAEIDVYLGWDEKKTGGFIVPVENNHHEKK